MSIDLFRAALRRRFGWRLVPLYIPVFGRPGEFAFAHSAENPSVRSFGSGLEQDAIATSASVAEFWRVLPKKPRGGWENKMLARMLADFDRFVPIDRIEEIKAPILFVAATRDDLVPVESVEEAARRAAHPQSRCVKLDCPHFAVYLPPFFNENITTQVAFLQEISVPPTDGG